MLTALCQIVDGLMAVRFLADRSRRLWIGTMAISAVAFAGSLVLCSIGYLWALEARRRLGDPGPWDVLAAWLVLVYPLVLQTIPLGVFGACLYLLRPTPASAGNGAGR
jgi:hypothetical protein